MVVALLGFTLLHNFVSTKVSTLVFMRGRFYHRASSLGKRLLQGSVSVHDRFFSLILKAKNAQLQGPTRISRGHQGHASLSMRAQLPMPVDILAERVDAGLADIGMFAMRKWW